MRHCWGTTPVFQTEEPHRYGGRPASGGATPLSIRYRDTDTHHRESPQTNFARNLGTLTFLRCRKNRRIPTIRFQNLKYGQGNYVRHCWGTTPVSQTEEPHNPRAEPAYPAPDTTRPRPVSRPRPRRAQSVPLSKAAPPAIRRSYRRGPRPRRDQPRGGRRGRGTGSRTRSRHPRCGRSGSTAGRHRARHTRRA